MRHFTSGVFALLATLLILSATHTWMRVGGLNDIPWGCDLFGHLKIADDFRTAFREKRLPTFHLKSAQAEELAQWFLASGTPVEQWSEMIAPQAHHYAARTHQVI